MAAHALAALAALLVLAPEQVLAKTQRDPHQRAAFMKQQPCPSTGKTRGACPGYVVDHIKPLCAGGPDRPSNMQWQTVADAKVKDKQERQMCGSRH
jgi:hypothetical protein